LQFYKKHILDILDHLPKLVKNGPNPGILPQDFSSPLFEAESTKNSGAWIIAGGFDPALEIIIHLPEFNSWGLFINFQEGMTQENTKPDVMLAHTPHALAAGKTMTFKQGQIADAMIRTGFKSVQSRTLTTPLNEMDLDIARK
jgi:hypothetical protein